MIDGKSVLAIIPARAGSKRLPGKNTRILGGKPMIIWTVEAARASKYIDLLLVTTNDREVIDCVRPLGVRVIHRPEELCGDKASSYDTIFHAIDLLPHMDYTMLLQPTSPLRTVEDIDGCVETCVSKNAPSCITVTRSKPDANGAVYIAWTTWLRETRLFDSGRVVTHLMPGERSVDIDTLEDFQRAESIVSSRGLGASSKRESSSILPFSEKKKPNTLLSVVETEK